MRDAVLTVSPMRVYLKPWAPTRSADAGPECRPTRIWTAGEAGAEAAVAA
jgi:hypothetical protein